jgi:hypothetical protein
MAAKCVDRSGPSQNVTAVRHAAWDEVFLSGLPPRLPAWLKDQEL